jgi:membrane glycosyltransferase
VITHTSHTIIGCAWAIIAYAIRPDVFWWLSPVWLGLISSVPLSVILSRKGTGTLTRRLGLFLTAYETPPPPVVVHLQKNIAACRKHIPPPEPLQGDYGLMQIIVDPYLNAVHAGLLHRAGKSIRTGEHYERLQTRLLKEGPNGLSRREKLALMLHYPTISALHQRLWLMPYDQLSPWWQMAMHQYNTLTSQPASALYR